MTAPATATSGVEFHRLMITEVGSLTDDAVSISFDVPDELGSRFRHVPGQHIVVRADIDGQEVRRTYSVCSPPGQLTIGIKRIPDGVFSTYATTELAPGRHLDVMAPIGEFTLPVQDRSTPTRYVAIVAGSGITPVLSMVSTALTENPDSRFTVIYGNRTSQSIMFIEELEGLKDRYPSRLQLIHVLSREPHQIPLFQGRIDDQKLRSLAASLIDVESVDRWFLCGPLAMVETAQGTLADLGVEPDRVSLELFFDQRIEAVEPSPDDEAEQEGACEVLVTIDGRTSTVRALPDGPSLLDYARSVRAEVPFACKGGMCATCKASVISGEVTMTKNYALTDEELAAGFVLTCQAHPVTATVHLDYDVRG